MLIFDLSNMAHICAHQHSGQLDSPDYVNLVEETMTYFMRRIYRRISPTGVFFACDHSEYWRREVFPEYKANRPMTPKKLKIKQAVKQFKSKQAKLCIEHDQCEADDVIYAFTQQVEDECVVVSTDGDFLQLASSKVKLFDPRQQKYKPYKTTRDLDLFVKCIRGDRIDNIPTAFPRVSQKRLQQAHESPHFMEQLLNTCLADGSSVRDQYNKNRTLIDLSQIPEHILLSLNQVIQQKLNSNTEVVS